MSIHFAKCGLDIITHISFYNKDLIIKESHSGYQTYSTKKSFYKYIIYIFIFGRHSIPTFPFYVLFRSENDGNENWWKHLFRKRKNCLVMMVACMNTRVLSWLNNFNIQGDSHHHVSKMFLFLFYPLYETREKGKTSDLWHLRQKV